MEPPTPRLLEIRQRFEAECAAFRPDLQRFCTRMTGSVTDGEDLLQETLVHAFYHLPELREGAALRPWLFRIAHNSGVDWQRRRKAHLPLEDEPTDDTDHGLDLERRELAQTALAAIFTQLPPRERAGVVLKDVLGYSLEETAQITACSLGAVKAAIFRGREKLARAVASHRPPRLSEKERGVIDEYVARFNQRDWIGVQAMLTDDARLEVRQRLDGPFSGQYFTNYARLGWEWRIGWAVVEGTPCLVHFRSLSGVWQPHSVIELELRAGKISAVRDYVHVADLLSRAHVEDWTRSRFQPATSPST